MRDDHIIKMLEQAPVNRLSADELALIKAHAVRCPDCLRAYDASRLASSLIRARASEITEVRPFFEARVLARIRENQLRPELPSIMRWWMATRAILSMMTAMLVVLIGLTIFTGRSEQPETLSEMAASQSIFSPEYVVFDESGQADDIAYDQMLGMIYDSEDDDGN